MQVHKEYLFPLTYKSRTTRSCYEFCVFSCLKALNASRCAVVHLVNWSGFITFKHSLHTVAYCRSLYWSKCSLIPLFPSKTDLRRHSLRLGEIDCWNLSYRHCFARPRLLCESNYIPRMAATVIRRLSRISHRASLNYVDENRAQRIFIACIDSLFLTPWRAFLLLIRTILCGRMNVLTK